MQTLSDSTSPASQEMAPYHAYQVECLSLMGSTVWLTSHSANQGTVYRPALPWSIQTGIEPEHAASQANHTQVEFQSGVPERKPKSVVLGSATNGHSEPISSSVLNLKNELASGPELIVEDLQPIEEKSVQIEAPKEVVTGLPARVVMTGYWLASDLFILTDVPFSFSEQGALDKLALNLGKALLKREITEWRSSGFSWPDQLRNPYFATRQDWQIGAFESFLSTLFEVDKGGGSSGTAPVKSASGRLIVAGVNAQKMIKASSVDVDSSLLRIAEVESLPQMLKIPELRKEAWQVMQAAFKG
ncbi:hypothetical protein [Marinomonas mediterranea]|uniref:hypothetical protein n=1 Tax=Marinomonas mediterranea TaxID=119864 RepID=UPI002349051E|nr:hypothetical protein [Marinomonas mediterranea]WCN10791.1 hypothetical protein GV055_18600 [Marinomonas mediterranea]